MDHYVQYPRNSAHHPITKQRFLSQLKTLHGLKYLSKSTHHFVQAPAQYPSRSGLHLSSTNPQKYLQCHRSSLGGQLGFALLHQRHASVRNSSKDSHDPFQPGKYLVQKAHIERRHLFFTTRKAFP